MVKLVNQTLFVSKIKEKNILLFTAAEIRVIFGVSTVAAVGLIHRDTPSENS